MISIFMGAKGDYSIQAALVTQFLGNYLLAVHLFFTKSYPWDRVRHGIIPGQLSEDCLFVSFVLFCLFLFGRYSDVYGRRTSLVSKSCETVPQVFSLFRSNSVGVRKGIQP